MVDVVGVGGTLEWEKCLLGEGDELERRGTDEERGSLA